MASTRTKYDLATYQVDLAQFATNALNYTLSPLPTQNPNKCRHELGLVGGTAVSHIKGNLVDLESDLRGQNRYLSRCPSKQYQPPTGNMLISDKASIDTSLTHLGSCQMFPYAVTPLPPNTNFGRC